MEKAFPPIPNADGYKLTFCLVFILIGDQHIVCFVVFIQHTFYCTQQQSSDSLQRVVLGVWAQKAAASYIALSMRSKGRI